jgi:hypothetical protein
VFTGKEDSKSLRDFEILRDKNFAFKSVDLKCDMTSRTRLTKTKLTFENV